MKTPAETLRLRLRAPMALPPNAPFVMSPLLLATLAACAGGGGTPNESGTIAGAGGLVVLGRVSGLSFANEDGVMPTFFSPYAADLNGDGITDFVIAAGSYPPDDPASFAPQILLSGTDGYTVIDDLTTGTTHPRELDTGDFNGDGVTDFILIGHGYDADPFPGETNALYLGTGSGFEDASDWLPDSADFSHSVTVSDINGDGYDDIFIGNIWGEEQVLPYLLINQGGSGFAKLALNADVFDYTAGSASGTRLYTTSLFADLDGDGTDSLILGMDKNSSSLILDFDPLTEDFIVSQTLPDGVFGRSSVTVDIQVGDVNGDGLADIVMSQTPEDYDGRGLQLLLQTADGSFEDATASAFDGFDTSGDWIMFILLDDFDGDGDLDLAGTNAFGLTLLENDGTGRFTDLTDGGVLGGSEDSLVTFDYALSEIYALSFTSGDSTIVIEQYA
ncbi:VCBS repeat-containing protein [Pseudooceanicola sp. CBS1P-1]|nr:MULTISPECIES: VCBS repeat-containing protein [Pseudooceanicola]MBT9383419.1 VCBS repeat-containing protein [Pseudooceanicola endophyticus]